MRTGSLLALVLALILVPSLVPFFVPAVALADSRAQLAIGDGIANVAAPTTDVTEILASVGYDAPRGSVGSTLTARVALVPHLALVGGASTEVGPWRPRLGAIGSLRLGTTDLAVTGQYKAQGFNEPEGELEMIVSAGHKLGAAYTIVEAAFGADFDGRDRDGELAAAVTLPIGSIVAGSTARGRYAFGGMAELGASWDAVIDVGAALPFGRYAVRGAVGVSMRETDRVEVGPVTTLTVVSFF